jgi:hypothetical protein
LPKEKLAIQLAADTAASQLPAGETLLPSAFWEELSKQTGDVDAYFLRRYCSPEERARVVAYLASANKAEQERKQALLAKAQQPSYWQALDCRRQGSQDEH